MEMHLGDGRCAFRLLDKFFLGQVRALQGAINARSQAAPCLWRSRISGSTERFCCDWQDNFKSSSSCHSISGNTLFLSVAPALWASGILVGAASDLCAVDSCKVSQGPARLPLQDPFKPFRCCFSLVSSLDPQRIPTRAALEAPGFHMFSAKQQQPLCRRTGSHPSPIVAYSTLPFTFSQRYQVC
jgi:hypothetical protein